jgi:transcription antitermination factor NusG
MAKRTIMDKQWFVVYTKPHIERKVSEILTRKKIENYFPLNRIVGDWNVNNKIIDEPLFATYIFVRMAAAQVPILKKVSGIVNLVYWLRKPVVMDDLEISIIKSFLNDHINVSIEKTVLGSDTLRKFDSSSLEEEESLMTVKNKRIRVALPSLGYIMSAEVETSNVRVISSDNLVRRPKLISAKLFNPVNSFNNFFKN